MLPLPNKITFDDKGEVITFLSGASLAMRSYGQPRRVAKRHFLSGRHGPFSSTVHWGVNISSCHALQALGYVNKLLSPNLPLFLLPCTLTPTWVSVP